MSASKTHSLSTAQLEISPRGPPPLRETVTQDLSGAIRDATNATALGLQISDYLRPDRNHSDKQGDGRQGSSFLNNGTEHGDLQKNVEGT
jgi:hypothetical protein